MDNYKGEIYQKSGLKPKDLCMIPARVALALQADGWWIRSEIVWAKPNPMPESVTDRPTKAHEMIYLLTKSARYYYDADAVREGNQRYFRKAGGYKNHHEQMVDDYNPFKGKGGFADSDIETIGRNLRSVWTIATQPFAEAHFATFPERIPEICIKAGTSEKGACPKCGKPWERVVEKGNLQGIDAGGNYKGRENEVDAAGQNRMARSNYKPGMSYENKTLGWQPGCSCGGEPVPCVVMDIFFGSGTVGLVAEKLNRRWIGIELNPDYAEMAKARILKKAWNVEEGQANWIQEGMFT